jgi:two-component system, cell cycle sensor histidine kinase and response regulator CckA
MNDRISDSEDLTSLQQSALRWEVLVANAPDYIMLLDRAFNIRFINRTLSHLSIEGVTGTNIFSYIPPDNHPLARKTFEQVLASGTAASFESLSIGDQGSPAWYKNQVAPIASLGHDTELLLICTNITDRRKVEARLRESEQRFNLFMDNLPACAWIKNPERRYVYVNRAYEETFQLRPGEWLGRTTEEIWPDSPAKQFDEMNRIVRSTRKVVQTVESTQEGSKTRQWLVTKFPIVQKNSEEVFLGAVGLDITEAKKTEEQRLLLERKLLETQKLESLGILAGGIAHDFNNLLAIIVGNTNIARLKVPNNSPVTEQLEIIEAVAQQAAGICRQMLAYASRRSTETAPINVNKIIPEVRSLLVASVRPHISVVEEYGADVPDVVADDPQMRQVIMNLLINAAEAIGDVPGTIKVQTQCIDIDTGALTNAEVGHDAAPGKYVSIEVTDSGCGMDAATRAKMFDPFFSTKFTGRGLGLAAVLGIIRNHKGAISVKSEPGRGTTMTILLPCNTNLPPVETLIS